MISCAFFYTEQLILERVIKHVATYGLFYILGLALIRLLWRGDLCVFHDSYAQRKLLRRFRQEQLVKVGLNHAQSGLKLLVRDEACVESLLQPRFQLAFPLLRHFILQWLDGLWALVNG